MLPLIRSIEILKTWFLSLRSNIAGFHRHSIIKTIQQIKSSLKEIKEENNLYPSPFGEKEMCTKIVSDSQKGEEKRGGTFE